MILTLYGAQGELDGNVTLADDIYMSVKQSSGLTQGMTCMGFFAVALATVGMCGSIRSNSKCLYCYAVSSMVLLVAQSIVIALLNYSVEDLDATVKTVIQDSDAAKDLVRHNGQQALYVGLFAFAIEVIGFFISLVARDALNHGALQQDRREAGRCDDDLNFQLSVLHAQTEGPDGPGGWLQRAASARMASRRD